MIPLKRKLTSNYDSSSSLSIQIHDFKLTSLEESIFAAVKTYAISKDIIIRCAGGWLLGLQSNDIDFAVTKLKGTEFAIELRNFLIEKGFRVSNIGNIKLNPEQSKHLETATFNINGISIDCNSLRTDTYTSDSRIPEIKIGTAEEDAYRRDFTMNALFYNINTGEVEDFTKHGLSDLKNGFIRTPLPPLSTFLDDPLRVLRAIRFASRFGFNLDPELLSTSNSEDLKICFNKVSKERFGIELSKMLKGSDPVFAIELLMSFKLHNIIFALPNDYLFDYQIVESKFNEGLILMREIRDLLSSDNIFPVGYSEFKKFSDDLRLSFNFSALLYPFANDTYKEKNKSFPVSHFIVLHSVKLKNEYSDNITSISNGCSQFINLLSDIALKANISDVEKLKSILHQSENRLIIGRIIKRCKQLWIPSLMLASKNSPELSNIVLNWIVNESGLAECWSWLPYIKGDMLISKYGFPKSPLLTEVLTKMIEWRYENEWRLTDSNSQEQMDECLIQIKKSYPLLFPQS